MLHICGHVHAVPVSTSELSVSDCTFFRWHVASSRLHVGQQSKDKHNPVYHFDRSWSPPCLAYCFPYPGSRSANPISGKASASSSPNTRGYSLRSTLSFARWLFLPFVLLFQLHGGGMFYLSWCCFLFRGFFLLTVLEAAWCLVFSLFAGGGAMCFHCCLSRRFHRQAPHCVSTL